MNENLLEEKIEKLIEEKAEKIEKGEETDSKLGKLIEKKIEQKVEEEPTSNSMPEKTSRRNFMKMLGLGAGGLALSSAASAGFFSVNKNINSSKTISDILSNGNDAGGNSITNLGSLTVNNDITSNSADITNQVSAGSLSTTGTITAGSEIVLPDLSSDPSASTGAMWYRSDLE